MSICVIKERVCYTDDRQSYRKYIPPEHHVIGKADTWRIERRNLNFRTHIAEAQ
ncbi:MAG: hypothetical protein GY841_11095 [FCB group bacterium]|nr:hypothetical protein [FCB group bacterium]